MSPHSHRRGTSALSSLLGSAMAIAMPHTVSASPEAPEAAPELEATADDPVANEKPLHEQRQDVRVQVAERHYVEGMMLFERRQYRQAALEFERSHAAIPAARTLYSIGLSHERSGETVAALEAYRRYLELPDCSEPKVDALRCAEQRPEVERSVERLQPLVGELQLELAPGVKLREVRVAGRVVPLEDFPIPLMPGPTEVELFGPEPEDHRLRIPRIVAAESYVLRVSPFARAPAPRIEPEDPPPATERPDRDREAELRRTAMLKQVFWIGLGVTLASGATTGILGAFTRRENRLYVRDRCPEPCPQDPEDPAWRPYPLERDNRFHALRTTTNVMIGVTAAFGLATVVVGALAFSRRDTGAQRANVRLSGNGLTVRW